MLWDSAGWLFYAIWILKHRGLDNGDWDIRKSLDRRWSVLSEMTKVNIRPENPVGTDILAPEPLHDIYRSSLEPTETIYCGMQNWY